MRLIYLAALILIVLMMPISMAEEICQCNDSNSGPTGSFVGAGEAGGAYGLVSISLIALCLLGAAFVKRNYFSENYYQ